MVRKRVKERKPKYLVFNIQKFSYKSNGEIFIITTLLTWENLQFSMVTRVMFINISFQVPSHIPLALRRHLRGWHPAWGVTQTSIREPSGPLIRGESLVSAPSPDWAVLPWEWQWAVNTRRGIPWVSRHPPLTHSSSRDTLHSWPPRAPECGVTCNRYLQR